MGRGEPLPSFDVYRAQPDAPTDAPVVAVEPATPVVVLAPTPVAPQVGWEADEAPPVTLTELLVIPLVEPLTAPLAVVVALGAMVDDGMDVEGMDVEGMVEDGMLMDDDIAPLAVAPAAVGPADVAPAATPPAAPVAAPTWAKAGADRIKAAAAPKMKDLRIAGHSWVFPAATNSSGRPGVPIAQVEI